MTSHKTKPRPFKAASKWRQIRLHPEEEALIREISKRTGLSLTSTTRQLLRKALGLTSAGL